MSDVLATQAGNCQAQGEPHDSTATVGEPTSLHTLRVYKEVCHRIRSSLVAGRNEIVSPTTISKSLVKETMQKQEMSCLNGEAPSAESPGGAMEHTVVEESCPFLEAAEGWTIEYSGGGCEVSQMGLGYRRGSMKESEDRCLVLCNEL